MDAAGWLTAAVAARAVRRSTTVSLGVSLQAPTTAVATAPASKPLAIGAIFRVPHQVVPVCQATVYGESLCQVSVGAAGTDSKGESRNSRY